MKRQVGWRLLLGGLALLLAGCGGLPKAQETLPVAIVYLESPGICSRLVQTHSDVALIRPDFQHVITQGCAYWNGMDQSPVLWLKVESQEQAHVVAREVVLRSTQEFTRGKSRMGRASEDLKSFAATASKAREPIRVTGHVDSFGGGQRDEQEKLARRRAQSVADWLVKQGIHRSRIQVGIDTDPAQTAEASMTLIVKGF